MKFSKLKEKIIHNHFFRIKEALVQFDQFDGSKPKEVVRYGIDKGPAVACIVYVSDIEKYVIIEQFRYPVTLIEDENPWIYEIVAGTIDGNETPEETARKEIQEEAGFAVKKIELVQELFLSPGISSELIYLFYAEVTTRDRVPTGDPHDDEEDIKVTYLNRDEIRQLLAQGIVKDVKTLAALQHILLMK